MQSAPDETRSGAQPLTHTSGTVTVNASDTGALSSLSYSDPLAILGTAPFPGEPWWRRLSPSTIFVLLASAIAVFFLAHELLIADTSIVGDALGFPADQAWTHQVYARNFFHHIDFEFNRGERTASPAAPFWVVFLSIGLGLFHDPLLAAKLLGAIFLFLTGYYSFRVLKSVSVEHAASLFGGALVMTSSALAWAELSGLESCLAAALIVGGLWWLIAGTATTWTHAAITGAIFALATLTRPEAALIFLVILIHSFFARPHPVKNLTIMLAAFVLTLAPIGITNYAIGGSAFPPALSALLTPSSALRLIREGDMLHLAERIVLSAGGIWRAIRDLYVPENPLWLFTILLALVSRWRRPLIPRDAVDSLLALLVPILVLYPYFLALLTGVNVALAIRNPATAGATPFVMPVYELAGVLSVAAIVRRELFRSISPKQLLAPCAVAVLALGITLGICYLGWSVTEFILLFLLTGLFFFIATHHAGIRLGKEEGGHTVLEADRNKMTFHRDNEPLLIPLSEPSIAVLRGLLLIILAWNLVLLPHMAHMFANDVHSENTTQVAMARVIAARTQPTEAVATNAIGAIGFFSDRHVVDLTGQIQRLPMPPNLAASLVIWHPMHLAIFGVVDDRSSASDSTIIARGRSRGLLKREFTLGAFGHPAAELYQVNSFDSSAWLKE